MAPSGPRITAPTGSLAEPELARDDRDRLVGEQVQVPGDHAQIHLVQAEVGEDRQVPGGQHLVEVLVFGDGQVQVGHHLAGQGPVQGRGEVGQEHRGLPADHPDGDEEVILHRGQPDRAADAGLLVEHMDQPGQVLGERGGQQVHVPGVIFAVHDDGDIVAL